MGLLSRWYANLKPMPTRRAIAGVYAMDEDVLRSWLHHLNHVRNVCAHHARLWNREFTIIPNRPRSKPAGLGAQFNSRSRRLYNTLVLLVHCMDVVAPKHRWRARLRALLAKHDIDVSALDFPSGWEQMPIWQETSH